MSYLNPTELSSLLQTQISTGPEEIHVEIAGDIFTKRLQPHIYGTLHTSAALPKILSTE